MARHPFAHCDGRSTGHFPAADRPGESFTYEFTPLDAGTFWYHPHADALQQLGRGMAGALIVEEPQPIGVDRDVLWLIADWRLKSDAQIASGFGNGMEAAMSGRVGNTVTINGAISDGEPVRAGERVRLRLVNAALARIMALRFEGHRPAIVAIDGQPCEPHEPDDGRVLLGPAMRVDLMLDMAAAALVINGAIARQYGQYPKLRIVYKEFPILGPGSVFAAKAALAANKQGKYEAFHGALYQVRGAVDEAKVLEVAKTGATPEGRSAHWCNNV